MQVRLTCYDCHKWVCICHPVTAWLPLVLQSSSAPELRAGIYGSQGRADFTVDDVEHYFNYMGMLAVEGTYDRMEEMLSSGQLSQYDRWKPSLARPV